MFVHILCGSIVFLKRKLPRGLWGSENQKHEKKRRKEKGSRPRQFGRRRTTVPMFYMAERFPRCIAWWGMFTCSPTQSPRLNPGIVFVGHGGFWERAPLSEKHWSECCGIRTARGSSRTGAPCSVDNMAHLRFWADTSPTAKWSSVSVPCRSQGSWLSTMLLQWKTVSGRQCTEAVVGVKHGSGIPIASLARWQLRESSSI